MRGENLCVIWKRQELVMNAPVHDRGKLLGSVVGGKVGPSHIPDEKRIAGEDGFRPIRLTQIAHHHANALDGMPGRLQELEPALSEPDFVSIANRGMGELGPGPCTQSRSQVDASSRAFSKLVMTRDKVGVQMSLDNM